MKITKNEQEFIKANRSILLEILKKRKEDYVSALIDEEDEIKSKVMKLWIKELDVIIVTINNISNIKDKKKDNEEKFTGI